MIKAGLIICAIGVALALSAFWGVLFNNAWPDATSLMVIGVGLIFIATGCLRRKIANKSGKVNRIPKAEDPQKKIKAGILLFLFGSVWSAWLIVNLGYPVLFPIIMSASGMVLIIVGLIQKRRQQAESD